MIHSWSLWRAFEWKKIWWEMCYERIGTLVGLKTFSKQQYRCILVRENSFIKRHHLGSCNCGGLGQRNICRQPLHQTSTGQAFSFKPRWQLWKPSLPSTLLKITPTLLQDKNFQAKPTKQDLGTSWGVLFKISMTFLIGSPLHGNKVSWNTDT